MSDLIKREDAMMVAFKSPFFSNALMEEIEVLPSADRPKGEWIKSKTHASMWVCSNCDWGYQDCYDFDYCPSCGADMRGEDDE